MSKSNSESSITSDMDETDQHTIRKKQSVGESSASQYDEPGPSRSTAKRTNCDKDETEQSTGTDHGTFSKKPRMDGSDIENCPNRPSPSSNTASESSNSPTLVIHDDDEPGPSRSPAKRSHRKKEANTTESDKPKRKPRNRKAKSGEPSASVPKPKRARKPRSKRTSKDSDSAASSSVNATVTESSAAPSTATVPTSFSSPSSSPNPDSDLAVSSSVNASVTESSAAQSTASVPTSPSSPPTSPNPGTNTSTVTSAPESVNHTVEQSSPCAAGIEESNSSQSNSTVNDNPNQLTTYETPVSSSGTASENSTPTTSQAPPANPGTSTGGNFRERFNQRNTQVIPLRHASELIVGSLYRIHNVQRVNTRYGTSIRAEIADDRSPVSRSFLFLPTRFRDTSDDDIRSMNEAAAAGNLHLIYRGRIGKADIIDIV